MAAPSDSTAGHRPPALLPVFVVPVVVAIALATFAWPPARLEPRDLPLGLAGPAQALGPIEQKLAESRGAFDVHRYDDEAAAREAIEDRDVYGAVVASSGGVTLLTASAASPLVAGVLEESFAAPPEPSGETNGEPPARVAVVDVVRADPDDPRGSSFNALVLPLVLSGVITGVIVSLTTRAGPRQVGIVTGAGVGAGLVAVAMVQGWLDVIGGPWIVNAGVLGLTMLAIALVMLGFYGLIGLAGLALGAILMVFIGNPWSGISSAPEMLPEPVGLIGQLLPPGAGGNLLRSTAFFDGADAGGHLAVLLGWAALGLGAILAATRRSRRTGAASA